jgi:hypothetical protein
MTAQDGASMEKRNRFNANCRSVADPGGPVRISLLPPTPLMPKKRKKAGRTRPSPKRFDS